MLSGPKSGAKQQHRRHQELERAKLKLKRGVKFRVETIFWFSRITRRPQKNRGSLNFFANRESEEGWRTIFGFLQRSSLASKRLARSDLLEISQKRVFLSFDLAYQSEKPMWSSLKVYFFRSNIWRTEPLFALVADRTWNSITFCRQHFFNINAKICNIAPKSSNSWTKDMKIKRIRLRNLVLS